MVKWVMLCSLDGCERPKHVRGWCRAHYKRFLRWGDPHGKYRLKDEAVPWINGVVSNADSLRCGEADWPFLVDSHGYGFLTYQGRKTRAHRLVLSLVTGAPVISDAHALHSCDRPVCCNPGCLRWGTDQENADDRGERNRSVRGERVNTAKLTSELVTEMRNLHAETTVSHRELALRYGVKEPTVFDILHRRSWKHVP